MVDNFWKATSVHSGWPSSAMNNWIWWASMSGDLRITARQCHEPDAKRLDRLIVVKKGDLADRALGERQAKACVDQLD
jgi:hypothetical protein